MMPTILRKQKQQRRAVYLKNKEIILQARERRAREKVKLIYEDGKKKSNCANNARYGCVYSTLTTESSAFYSAIRSIALASVAMILILVTINSTV